MKIGCVASAPGYRDNGTYAYCRYALTDELGIKIQAFHRSSPIPEDHGCDFFLYVDDGLDHIPMNIPTPNACYLIDTHLGWDVRREWANHFDTVFCAQKPSAEKMKEEGLDAHWLPLACSPRAHPNFAELTALKAQMSAQTHSMETASEMAAIFMESDLSKIWDVVFVGYMNGGVPGHPKSHNRIEILDKLFKAIPNQWSNVNCFHEQMAARYVKGRVGFNVSILDDLNMRFFEIPSTGTAMLANKDVVGWRELGFEDGVHFVGYDNVDDAIDKARWMLKNPMEREQIAQAGHRLVRENHTYAHRMETILSTCGIDFKNKTEGV
jgi:spore maturation protein CgeB